jgi:hypothetical protein
MGLASSASCGKFGSVKAQPETLPLAERVREPIRRAAQMEADFSVESLAAVDHFVRTLPAQAPAAVAATADDVGCYFGEVLRRALGACWQGSPAEEPRSWRLVFDAVPLSISPVGMAAQAIYEDEVGEYDGALDVPDSLRGSLARALEAMGEVDEAYYYSLTGRFETIQHVLDVLVAGKQPRRR